MVITQCSMVNVQWSIGRVGPKPQPLVSDWLIAVTTASGITALATTTATVTWFILLLGQLSSKCLCIHKLRLLDKLSARDVGLSLLVG